MKSYAEEILGLTSEARAAAEMIAGYTARPVAKLPRWLSGFQNDHPDIVRRLKVAGSGELLRGLEDGGIDVVFCFGEGDLHEGFSKVGCVYRRMFDKAFAEAGIVPPKLAAEVGSIAAIAGLVAAGVGLALVPRLAVTDAIDRSEIVEIPWPAPAPQASLVMIWRRRRVQPSALKLLLASASDNFASVKSAGARPRRAVSSPS